MDRIFNAAKCSCDFITDCKQLGIGDMTQYQRESLELSYNKLCVIQIANSSLLMTYLGGVNYFSHLRKAVEEIYQYVIANRLDAVIHPYIMDNATFLIAGEPKVTGEFFKTNMSELYKKFYFFTPAQTNIPILFRFSVVSDQHHMLERAIEALQARRNAQKCFILCDQNMVELEDAKHELNMMGVIQWALENNGVVPYYQGIYNNREGGIDKYESLMRIVDARGVVYFPADFMQIAKKHHIYARLSEMMIRRVLRECEDKPIAVSINLSAYDINSTNFQKFLFEMLEIKTSGEMLVFEILEDEVFEDPEVLRKFVSSVKQFGVKIAIDDFGSGYSNLLEIAQITPEYLKIDGGIIVRMNDSHRCRGVFESVLYLAQKIGIKTVAEHVESIELQRSLERYGVDFSQGYYISRPMPIELLQTVIDKNKGVIM